MNISTRKTNPLIKTLNNLLIDLPCPSRISNWWNFGSLLRICLLIQLLTGIFLAIHYTANIELAFNSVIHIIRNVNNGWIIRSIHANGASFFFICIYIHVGRGIYYNSYQLTNTWIVGVIILLLTIATAFLGYVLPWGQMSLWGATVITNLLSVIPYVGNNIILWLWGGFSIENATLTRFFAIHFLIPFIITALVIIHLLYLHQTGSNNPLGVDSNTDKIPFHPYFSVKDIIRCIIILLVFILINTIEPQLLGDPENFIPANPLVTPVHIQPEWYFLFAYAILRSIPNKIGGVIAILAAIRILIILPLLNKPNLPNSKYYPLSKMLFWFFCFTWLLLTWIGAKPAEEPYIFTGQALSTMYFIYFILSPLRSKFWDKITQ